MKCLLLDFEKPIIMDESQSVTKDNLLSKTLICFIVLHLKSMKQTHFYVQTFHYFTMQYLFYNFKQRIMEKKISVVISKNTPTHTMERTIPLINKIIITERTKPLNVKCTPYNRNNDSLTYKTFP